MKKLHNLLWNLNSPINFQHIVIDYQLLRKLGQRKQGEQNHINLKEVLLLPLSRRFHVYINRLELVVFDDDVLAFGVAEYHTGQVWPISSL